MRYAYTIFYVADVSETIAFYERAFGLTRRFVHESGLYAELETGATTLAFAGEPMAEMNGLAIRPGRKEDLAPGVAIALVDADPRGAYERAVKAGAAAVAQPVEKPWGQVVGYVRDLNGCLVEICSAMGG